jgi:hypothetical protein
MAFWSDKNIEPKRKFKFLVDFDLVGNSNPIQVPTYIVKKVDKPVATISESKHDFFGQAYYYPGRLTWNEITMTIVDPGGTNQQNGDSFDAAETLMGFLQRYGYVNPVAVGPKITDGSVGPRSLDKSAGSLGINIRQVDSDGNTVERWILNNAFIKEVNFGGLDYTSDDINEVTIKVRYDWAEFVKGNNDQNVLPSKNDT